MWLHDPHIQIASVLRRLSGFSEMDGMAGVGRMVRMQESGAWSGDRGALLEDLQRRLGTCSLARDTVLRAYHSVRVIVQVLVHVCVFGPSGCAPRIQSRLECRLIFETVVRAWTFAHKRALGWTVALANSQQLVAVAVNRPGNTAGQCPSTIFTRST